MQFLFSSSAPAMQAKNHKITAFKLFIYKAILRTTLSDIRTGQKIVFPLKTISTRSKSAVSILNRSNERLLREETTNILVIFITRNACIAEPREARGRRLYNFRDGRGGERERNRVNCVTREYAFQNRRIITVENNIRQPFLNS